MAHTPAMSVYRHSGTTQETFLEPDLSSTGDKFVKGGVCFPQPWHPIMTEMKDKMFVNISEQGTIHTSEAKSKQLTTK